MPGRRKRNLIVFLLGLATAWSWFVQSALADGTEVIVTSEFTTVDVGSFAASLSLKTETGCGGDLDYGAFDVDAVGSASGVTPVSLAFCVHYEDTGAERDAFSVQLKIDSFELDSEPAFDGAQVAHFQIPNRYLILTSVGDVTGGATDTLRADRSDLNMSFSGATSGLRIAAADPGPGVISAEQEIELTLNIPAGVFPGVYTSTITVETVTGP